MTKPDDIVCLRGRLEDFAEAVPVSSYDDVEDRFQRYLDVYGFAALGPYFESYKLGGVEFQHGDVQYQIATHVWRHPTPCATVLVAHGLFDHVGLYTPLIEMLLQNGVNVIAFDLPEHGLSSGEYGQISDFSVYVASTVAVLDAVLGSDALKSAPASPLQTQPLYAVAQSTGAAVCMQYILKATDTTRGLDKLVCLAPLLRVRAWAKIRLSFTLMRFFLQRVPRNFTRNSHDDAFDAFLRHKDPLQPRYISVAWVGAMLKWARQFDAFSAVDLGGGIIQGTDDMTVDARYNLPKILAKFPRFDTHYIEGARHHLVRESQEYQQQAFGKIIELLCLKEKP